MAAFWETHPLPTLLVSISLPCYGPQPIDTSTHQAGICTDKTIAGAFSVLSIVTGKRKRMTVGRLP